MTVIIRLKGHAYVLQIMYTGVINLRQQLQRVPNVKQNNRCGSNCFFCRRVDKSNPS